ncbi:MAG: tetratricopeptide repeat protein [Cyanobacteria bacterium P01_D01_bin.44]
MAKKKKRSWAVAPRGFGSKNLDTELHKAEARIVHEQWADAYQILSTLGQQYPQEKRIWMYLTQVCVELDHFRGYQQACEHWLELDPNNGDLLYGLGFSYMVNQHPLLALQTFSRALECQPDHDGVDQVREAIPKLEAFAEEAKANFAESTEDWWEIALRHEQAQAYLEEGEYAKACQAEQDVLERQPDFLPARNNLSLVAWAEGDLDSAISTAQSVLAAAPNNTHALSNLIRFLTQQGNDAAAQPYAERLKAADEPDAWNPWTKKVEGLSYLGDDAAVVEVYEQWRATVPASEVVDALFHHLVAVALARLDQPQAARAQWKIALEESPGMTIAEKNLNELLFPIGQRHGAWPFGLNEWLSPKIMADFQQVLVSLKRSGKAGKLKSTFKRFFDEHPAFIKQAPKILERGGPEGQSFLVSMAEQIHIPEFMQAIKDFGLGQNGTDQMRNQAVVHVLKAGLVPRDKVRMWIEGEWRDVMLMGYELYGEPETGKHSRRVTDWLAEATSLLHEQSKDAALEAEEILQKALAVEPDAPDLLNNLAAAYMRLDREQEAEALILNIHERFPDYLFACTSLAKFHIRDREFDAAETLLKPFFKHERFHFSEFAALMDAQIELEIARKNYQAAETWLDMWAKADPDHPLIEYWDERLEAIPEL